MRPAPDAVTFFLAVALALPAACQSPPQETTDRLDAAFHALGAERFAGTFTVTARSDVSKLNGKDREEGLEVRRLTMRPGQAPTDELLQVEENGEDVTAESREREAKRAERDETQTKDETGDEDDEEGGSMSASFKLPMGDDLALYSFSPASREGAVLVTAFSPLPQHRKDNGMASGRLAWDPETLYPLWIEVRPATLPRGAKELSLRFEVARSGNLLYIGRTVTDGVGGILWIKRRFHVEVEISDVQPAT